MDAQTVAYIGATLAVATLGFTLLQLGSEQRSRGLYAALAALLLGLFVLATRGDQLGLAWMHAAERRSDVIALAAIVPLAATLAGVLAARATRIGWAQATLALASLACVASAFAALDIGRSTWYWEFVALIFGGIGLLTATVPGVLDRAAGANRRVVLGSFAAMGAFTALGGVALTLAWSAIG